MPKNYDIPILISCFDKTLILSPLYYFKLYKEEAKQQVHNCFCIRISCLVYMRQCKVAMTEPKLLYVNVI